MIPQFPTGIRKTCFDWKVNSFGGVQVDELESHDYLQSWTNLNLNRGPNNALACNVRTFTLYGEKIEKTEAKSKKIRRHGHTIGHDCFGTFKMTQINKDTKQGETTKKYDIKKMYVQTNFISRTDTWSLEDIERTDGGSINQRRHEDLNWCYAECWKETWREDLWLEKNLKRIPLRWWNFYTLWTQKNSKETQKPIWRKPKKF